MFNSNTLIKISNHTITKDTISVVHNNNHNELEKPPACVCVWEREAHVHGTPPQWTHVPFKAHNHSCNAALFSFKKTIKGLYQREQRLRSDTKQTLWTPNRAKFVSDHAREKKACDTLLFHLQTALKYAIIMHAKCSLMYVFPPKITEMHDIAAVPTEIQHFRPSHWEISTQQMEYQHTMNLIITATNRTVCIAENTREILLHHNQKETSRISHLICLSPRQASDPDKD